MKPGEIITIDCPFLRTACEVSDYRDGRYINEIQLGWKPGQAVEHYDGDSWWHANGAGKAVYHIVDVHKLPHPYKTRVFYIQTWIDPDGKAMGRKTVKIMAPHNLRERIKRSYERFHDIEMVEFTVADAKRYIEREMKKAA